MSPQSEPDGLIAHAVDPSVLVPQQGVSPEEVRTTTVACAREGMLKEAVVRTDFVRDEEARAWRLFSDEGAYLNGADQGPSPLAYFLAGCHLDFLATFLHGASNGSTGEAERRLVGTVSLEQHHRYRTRGSYVEGDATGVAFAPRLELQIETEENAHEVSRRVKRSLETTHSHALMKVPLMDTFDLILNEREVPAADGASSSGRSPGSPRDIFERLRNLPGEQAGSHRGSYSSAAGDSDHRAESSRLGEAGVGTRESSPGGAVQGQPNGEPGPVVKTVVKTDDDRNSKPGGTAERRSAGRTWLIHLRGRGTTARGEHPEAEVDLVNPEGSTFRFRADPRGRAAPPAFAYVQAGIAFCYLTQLERYVRLKRLPIDRYAVSQEQSILASRPDGTEASVRPHPLHTHVFLDGELDERTARSAVQVAESACFLHATLRADLEPGLHVRLNGEELSMES